MKSSGLRKEQATRPVALFGSVRPKTDRNSESDLVEPERKGKNISRTEKTTSARCSR